jgi:hypothetical protein
MTQKPPMVKNNRASFAKKHWLPCGLPCEVALSQTRMDKGFQGLWGNLYFQYHKNSSCRKRCLIKRQNAHAQCARKVLEKIALVTLFSTRPQVQA